MKFKLDENFSGRIKQLFLEAGHEVDTVRDEVLQGSPDELIYQTCNAEGRCLVTFDMDFTDIIRFPPENTSGIIVLRLPINPNLLTVRQLIRQALKALQTDPIEGNLWIVQAGRIRIRRFE